MAAQAMFQMEKRTPEDYGAPGPATGLHVFLGPD
jgi:hypothetical protein